MLRLPFTESSSTFYGSTPVKIAISIQNISFSSCNLQPLNISNHQYLYLEKNKLKFPSLKVDQLTSLRFQYLRLLIIIVIEVHWFNLALIILLTLRFIIQCPGLLHESHELIFVDVLTEIIQVSRFLHILIHIVTFHCVRPNFLNECSFVVVKTPHYFLKSMGQQYLNFTVI